MRSGEYDLMGIDAVGEHMTWDKSAPCITKVKSGEEVIKRWGVCVQVGERISRRRKVLLCNYVGSAKPQENMYEKDTL